MGQPIAKIPRDAGKTRDITGGLPRVTELFEARSPQKSAVVAEIDGTVAIDVPKRGSRKITITSFDDENNKIEYTVSLNKYVLVQSGDIVRAGDRLTDGSVDPHDILKISGVNAVQEYLVNEIQEVYRMQGVKINDKHIEVIVRQMLQKVRITNSGDSQFLEGDQIDRIKFQDENAMLAEHEIVTEPNDTKFKIGELVSKRRLKEVNEEVKKKGKTAAKKRAAEPAECEPILLGITSAALTTESFISAASFQETTRVLTEAAVGAKVDQLVGLKENIILGQLIPAGTGLRHIQDIVINSKVGNIFGENAIREDEGAVASEPAPAPKKGKRGIAPERL